MLNKKKQLKLYLVENVNVSMSNSTTLAMSQQQQTINYLNKEPFNEDIEIEECSLVHDLKWRSQVIDKIKIKIEEIKHLQTSSDPNVIILNKTVQLAGLFIIKFFMFRGKLYCVMHTDKVYYCVVLSKS